MNRLQHIKFLSASTQAVCTHGVWPMREKEKKPEICQIQETSVDWKCPVPVHQQMKEETAAGGSDMGRDGESGRGEFRDLHGSTAGLKNRLFQDGIYTFGCYLKSREWKLNIIASSSVSVFNLFLFYLDILGPSTHKLTYNSFMLIVFKCWTGKSWRGIDHINDFIHGTWKCIN